MYNYELRTWIYKNPYETKEALFTAKRMYNGTQEIRLDGVPIMYRNTFECVPDAVANWLERHRYENREAKKFKEISELL